MNGENLLGNLTWNPELPDEQLLKNIQNVFRSSIRPVRPLPGNSVLFAQISVDVPAIALGLASVRCPILELSHIVTASRRFSDEKSESD